MSEIDDILVLHQRRDIASCLCGWSELGRSHAQHQAAALTTGALLDELRVRGDRIDGPEGRALADYSRQLRCTLDLEIINGGRPEDPSTITFFDQPGDRA